MSFANMKKNRSNAIDALVNAAQANTKQTYSKDESFWAPTVDKAGNGYAVIRFLPAPEGETTPWVSYWDHGFQGPTGKWYIERSLTTLGQEDPLSQFNSEEWNSGIEEKKDEVRKRKRRLHYVANIMVISDSENPQNEGKVFKYTFGKKIFDKITEAMTPEFEDETPINPFDFWEGADFKVKIRKVEGYRNYDKSEFSDVSPLLDGDDEKLEKVYQSLYSLAAVNDPSEFKTYDELKRKLESVLCLASTAKTVAEDIHNDAGNTSSATSAPVADAADAPVADADAPASTEDALAYFRSMQK